MILSFDILGAPVGEPRHRSRAAKINGKWMAMAYPDKRADPWKRCVREAASSAIDGGQFPLTEPCRVELEFRMPRPKAHHVAGDRSRPLKDGAPSWHSSKPDLDNAVKLVLDAMVSWPKKAPALVLQDDDLVSVLVASKRYTLEGEAPGCRVTMTKIKDLP